MFVRFGFAIPTLILIALVGASACSNSATSPSTVTTIVVTGTAPAVGATSQFTATANLTNGSTQDVTSTATWTTSNAAYAKVSSSGVVTGVAPGSVAIDATYSGVTGGTSVTVP